MITGLNRSLARAFAERYASPGASVAVNFAGNQEAARQTVKACRSLGADAVALLPDVVKPNEFAASFAAAKDCFGRAHLRSRDRRKSEPSDAGPVVEDGTARSGKGAQ